jgi:septum formation protein
VSSPALVLASGSPQRRAILTQIGVAFTVHVTDADELTAGPPQEVVLENAFRKARAAADVIGSQVPVLGVDTIVALGARIFGKPADRAAARVTLEALAGREHVVLSGVCLIRDGDVRTAAARTRVRMRALKDDELEAYLETGEWRERAGGYAIQERGALLVAEIVGDYLNVVGLPVAALVEMMPGLLSGAGRRA